MYYTIYVSFYQRVTTVDEEDAGHDDAGHRRRDMMEVGKKSEVRSDACFTHVEFRAGDSTTCLLSYLISRGTL